MSTTEDLKLETVALLENLRQQRDELKVQIHLANMEVHDEWQDLERKWEHFKGKVKQLKDVADDSAEDVGETLLDLAHEVREGYRRIRDIL